MIDTVKQVLERKYKDLEQTAVYAWLHHQEAFQRARKASIRVLGSGTQIPDDSEINSLVNSFIKTYQMIISLEEYKKYAEEFSKKYTEEEIQKNSKLETLKKKGLVFSSDA